MELKMRLAVLSFVCAVTSVVAAAPPTSPPKWPDKGQQLWVSVYPFPIFTGRGKNLNACERMRVFDLYPADGQIWISPDTRDDVQTFTISGDWTLILTEDPKACWSRLRRFAMPISEDDRRDLEARTDRPHPAWVEGAPISCGGVGRKSPCESTRPIPIIESFIPDADAFTPPGWTILGVVEKK